MALVAWAHGQSSSRLHPRLHLALAGADAELSVGAVPVVFDRAPAEEQLCGDLVTAGRAVR